MQFWWAFGKPYQSLCWVTLYMTAFFLITPQCQPDQPGNHSWNQRRVYDYIKKAHEAKRISQIRGKLGTSKRIVSQVCINRGHAMGYEIWKHCCECSTPTCHAHILHMGFSCGVDAYFYSFSFLRQTLNSLRLNPSLMESRFGWNGIIYS